MDRGPRGSGTRRVAQRRHRRSRPIRGHDRRRCSSRQRRRRSRTVGDNASGTAALIELARGFAPQDVGPDPDASAHVRARLHRRRRVRRRWGRALRDNIAARSLRDCGRRSRRARWKRPPADRDSGGRARVSRHARSSRLQRRASKRRHACGPHFPPSRRSSSIWGFRSPAASRAGCSGTASPP